MTDNEYGAAVSAPIAEERARFISLFNAELSHADGMLGQALAHVRSRGGKRMRPALIMLIAKEFGPVGEVAYRAAIGLELLHTASLVHDDVVDESAERRGQPSANAMYDNKVAVLLGDYILSTALLNVSRTRDTRIVDYLARLGQTLSEGEIMQLSATGDAEFSESTYFEVVRRKTAALFEACAAMGAMAAGADADVVEAARQFGSDMGVAFQIRDDIFDYYADSQIGKPTGNDMAEGKLTLPVLHALTAASAAPEMRLLAIKVRRQEAAPEEIARLVEFAKQAGGMEYADATMRHYRDRALDFIASHIAKPDIRAALTAYLDYVVERTK